MDLLQLELLCGASDAPSDHPGFFNPDQSDIHPKHSRMKSLLAGHGIDVEVTRTEENGVVYSDARVHFDEGQIDDVIAALRETGFEGHVLEGPADRINDDVLFLACQKRWEIPAAS